MDSDNSTTATCCICLSEYGENETPFQLACGHRVHSDCMLRLCLCSRDSARCPYCRASLATRLLESEDDFEGLSDSGSESEENEPDANIEEGPELPQWMALIWTPFATGILLRRQEGVVKNLLKRAGSKRAPDVLKRCSEKQKQLQKDLVEARALVKKMKRGRACQTVQQTLRLLKRQENGVRTAERRLHAHKREVLHKCQKSQTTVNYLWLHPLADVM